MANQLRLVFSKLDCTPRWRERLPTLAIPALVVHGRRDRFFPVGNGEALARKIPGARLLVLEQARRRSPTRPPMRSQRRCWRCRRSLIRVQRAHARAADRLLRRSIGLAGLIAVRRWQNEAPRQHRHAR
jgi:hypothetical protein